MTVGNDATLSAKRLGNRAASQTYITSADNNGYSDVSPNTVRFETDVKFAELVKSLAKLCVEHELFKVEKFYSLSGFYSFSVDIEDEEVIADFDELLEEHKSDIAADDADHNSDGTLRVESITLINTSQTRHRKDAH